MSEETKQRLRPLADNLAVAYVAFKLGKTMQSEEQLKNALPGELDPFWLRLADYLEEMFTDRIETFERRRKINGFMDLSSAAN